MACCRGHFSPADPSEHVAGPNTLYATVPLHCGESAQPGLIVYLHTECAAEQTFGGAQDNDQDTRLRRHLGAGRPPPTAHAAHQLDVCALKVPNEHLFVGEMLSLYETSALEALNTRTNVSPVQLDPAMFAVPGRRGMEWVQ